MAFSMKTAARMTALAFGLLPLPAPAQGGATLYELIAREPYRSSWNRMIAPVLKHDRWLKGARGVWSPPQMVAADGAHFRVYFLCKPHDCADSKIAAIFEPNGRHAYGAFRNAAGTQLLGAPGPSVRKALLGALD